MTIYEGGFCTLNIVFGKEYADLPWFIVGRKFTEISRNLKYGTCLSDCNGTRTYNQLVRKRTLNHLVECSFTN